MPVYEPNLADDGVNAGRLPINEQEARDILLAKLTLLGIQHQTFADGKLDIWAPKGMRFVCNGCLNLLTYAFLNGTDERMTWHEALEMFDMGFESAELPGASEGLWLVDGTATAKEPPC